MYSNISYDIVEFENALCKSINGCYKGGSMNFFNALTSITFEDVAFNIEIFYIGNIEILMANIVVNSMFSLH